MAVFCKNMRKYEDLHQKEGWIYSFEKTFNLSIEDFYTKLDVFMAKPRTEKILLLEKWSI